MLLGDHLKEVQWLFQTLSVVLRVLSEAQDATPKDFAASVCLFSTSSRWRIIFCLSRPRGTRMLLETKREAQLSHPDSNSAMLLHAGRASVHENRLRIEQCPRSHLRAAHLTVRRPRRQRLLASKSATEVTMHQQAPAFGAEPAMALDIGEIFPSWSRPLC